MTKRPMKSQKGSSKCIKGIQGRRTRLNTSLKGNKMRKKENSRNSKSLSHSLKIKKSRNKRNRMKTLSLALETISMFLAKIRGIKWVWNFYSRLAKKERNLKTNLKLSKAKTSKIELFQWNKQLRAKRLGLSTRRLLQLRISLTER